MPRTARIVIPTVPHHITQRGNNRQDVFFVDDDRRVYLHLLKKQSVRFGLSVQSYCLMTNHIHLIATPQREHSLAKALGRTHYLYTKYINQMHNRSGHLWQNRFYSCPLGRQHFWRALHYVETNPVRAEIEHSAWQYKWSSAKAHVSGKNGAGLLDMTEWKRISENIDWKDSLKRAQSNDHLELIRAGTHSGRPLAGDSFLSKLEKLLGKRLRPLPAGRPKRERLKIEELKKSAGNRLKIKKNR